MAGKHPKQAADAFLIRLKQTLSCITDSFVKPSGYQPAPVRHSVTLVPRGGRAGDPATLKTQHGRRGLWLSVGHDYRVMHVEDDEHGRYLVRTASYAYGILDDQGDELLAYHWHPDDPFQPDGRSRVQAPHLHLSDTIRPISLGGTYQPVALADMHLRTGHVLLEDVVELLIEEFDVHPLKSTWQRIIDANRGRHPAESTW